MAEQTTPDRTLLDAFEQVFGPQEWDRPRDYDPAGDYDEATLQRSFGGLSARARREQRRPVGLVIDELGFDQHGGYHPSKDCA